MIARPIVQAHSPIAGGIGPRHFLGRNECSSLPVAGGIDLHCE
ncbi:hypothetical protein BIFBRE_04433 [Bifidobacterium breve DSM 20213 = JCM 1192]|uniref:Uncharacterized protein n=1 Tax=Bifidobacterium breve DSM 20213 = JCM 1192 TaxID=518634 RepID=D4BQQ6_BIFBR|nr:hypothetical protein BIFBRE_04433 [Bifidobacterium breve DSM 20213 = JCM 1192]